MKADEYVVVARLMDHLARAANVRLTEASDSHGAGSGTWVWLAERGPMAPAGRSRLYLRDLAEVAQVCVVLDGKSIRIGADHYAIRVTNDLSDAKGPLPPATQ